MWAIEICFIKFSQTCNLVCSPNVNFYKITQCMNWGLDLILLLSFFFYLFCGECRAVWSCFALSAALSFISINEIPSRAFFFNQNLFGLSSTISIRQDKFGHGWGMVCSVGNSCDDKLCRFIDWLISVLCRIQRYSSHIMVTSHMCMYFLGFTIFHLSYIYDNKLNFFFFFAQN